MRKIFWVAVLMFAGNLAVFGQNSQAQSQQAESRELHHRAWQTDIAKWKPLLDQYHAGKLDDHDGTAILFHMLTDYGLLHSTGTAAVEALSQEYQALIKKHPDYMINTPMRTHQQEAARGALKKKGQDLAEKRKNWTPQDGTTIDYHHGPYSAAVHQYRIDFAKNGKKFKMITFGYPVMPAFGWNGSQPPNRKIFVIGRSKSGYTRDTLEEGAIMRQLESGGKDPSNWVQPNANYKEFYGVISIDGKVLAQIPFHQHIPDKALQPVFADPDGKFAAFLVGHMAGPDDEDPNWGFSYEGVSGVILWTPKRGLRAVSLDEAKKEFPILEKWHIVP